MASRALIPDPSSPSRSFGGVVVAAVVTVVVVSLLLKLVLGVVFSLLGLVFPIGLVAGGLHLAGGGNSKLGWSAVVVGLLVLLI